MSLNEPELPNADLDLADRRDKWRTTTAMLALALVIAIAWALWSANSTSQDKAASSAAQATAAKNQASSEIVQKLSLAQQVAAACADKSTAADLGSLCVKAAVIVKQGPTGSPGANATTAQIEGAVAAYLADHPPMPGRNGSSPDPAVVATQIRSAVVAYASTHLPAPGVDGRPGVDGKPGADGAASTVPGPAGSDSTVPGPGPSTAQISAGVQAYCDANDFCRGPAGAASTVPGPAGTNGQTPTAMTCTKNVDPANVDGWDCTVTTWRP